LPLGLQQKTFIYKSAHHSLQGTIYAQMEVIIKINSCWLVEQEEGMWSGGSLCCNMLLNTELQSLGRGGAWSARWI